jgi:hypothetical protein
MIFSKMAVFNQKNNEYQPVFSLFINYESFLAVFEDKKQK